jgi:2,4-dienoyl-CoA reductase (NADPH2)
MDDLLFEPISLGALTIKNRIWMPAMHLNMAVAFEVTDPMVAFYEERARGGAGLISVGYATVDERSGNPMCVGAHDDAFIPGLRRLAAAIQGNGAHAAVQLNHSGRYNHSFMMGGLQPVAPSPIASRLTRETPHALTREEIHEVIQAFAAAARRVVTAGYDLVEVLSGTGYLISEFLSPLTNERDDDYGGSLENRMRFGLEIAAAIREEIGGAVPLVYRINGNDFMQGGQRRQELQDYAAALAGAGVDGLCVNVGWHEARVPQIVTSVPRGVFGYLARGIRERVDVPVIASHRINDAATAREMLADGLCDMVAMGRALIADPELPRKASEGREEDVVHCVACGQGCFDSLFKLQAVHCLCNPRAGRELELDDQIVDSPREVLVIGGGAAGMSAAIAAHDKGHRVTLVEASDRLGGQLHLAGAPPGREEFLTLARDLSRQVRLRGLRVILGRCADMALVRELTPDQVILATGAEPIQPAFDGVELPLVVQAWDVLSNRARLGERVVVLGGGAVGVETALFIAEKGTLSGDALKFLMVQGAEPLDSLLELATRGTREVLLIEALGALGADIGKSTRWTMMQDMKRLGVDARTSTRALAIEAAGVRVEDESGQATLIEADTVVLALGARPVTPLLADLESAGIPTTPCGDAQQVATALEAVHSGHKAGSTP